MVYHKIRGRSVAECMMKLRSNFGSDAIILEHREVNEGGILGSALFSRKLYEVEYMLPEKGKLLKGSLGTLSSERRPVAEKKLYDSTPLSKSSLPSSRSLDDMGADIPAYPSSRFEGQGMASKIEPIFSSPRRLNPEGPPSLDKFPFSADAFPKGGVFSGPKGDSLSHIKEELSRAQLSPAFISDFLRHLEDTLSRKERSERHIVEQKSLELLARMIQTQPSRAPVSGECCAIMLIGPTGVGKTTTLAKLAARFHIIEKRAVSIYSLDHYRLAATEQLKTYASVMSLDFFAPLSEEDFAESLQRDGGEMILIDSSGASHADLERLEELNSYLQVCRKAIRLETHLVLAANTNPSLLEKILQSYQALGFDKILLTKLDETDFIGPFVEFADSYKRPFSFVTDGQEVPSHIRDADPKEIAEMLLSSSTSEKSVASRKNK